MRDDQRRLAEPTPATVIPLLGGCCFYAFSSRKVVMPLGLSGQRSVDEVYTTNYDVWQRHSASNDILRFYATNLRSFIDAVYFKSDFIDIY